MKSLGVNFSRRFGFEPLRRRMINLPKARSAKFPMERQGEGIEARAKNDDLCNLILKCFACEEGEAFLSERVMTQDPGNGVFLEKFRDTEKPRPASKSKKQSRSS